jgi:hypothetical protein
MAVLAQRVLDAGEGIDSVGAQLPASTGRPPGIVRRLKGAKVRGRFRKFHLSREVRGGDHGTVTPPVHGAVAIS